jgi:gliding motility-associated-like protein
MCPGDSVLLNAGGGVSYPWFPAMNVSDPTSPTPWAYPVADEDYNVIVTSVYGCNDTLSMHIGVYPAALITLSDSVVLYPGESYQLSAVGNCTSFTWFPPEGLDTFNISNPVASPPFDTRYIVFGSTENGCLTSDTISIYLSNEALIAMPNAFTPGTGANNYFRPINKGLSSINYFRVFDRWGVMVFETTNLNSPGWDGAYKGVPQGFGVYMYDIQGVSLTGQIVNRHGNITLLR